MDQGDTKHGQFELEMSALPTPSTSSAIRQSSRTTLRQTIQPDEEAGLLRDSSLSPGLHGERPLLLVRFTGYHWLVVIVTVSLGTIKTVLVRTGHSATVNYLDLTIAVPVALGLWWLGRYEALDPPVLPWFFHTDYLSRRVLRWTAHILLQFIFGVMAGYSYFAMAFVVARAPGGRWGLRIVGKNGTVEVDHAFGFLEAARFFGLAGLSLLLMCSVPLLIFLCIGALLSISWVVLEDIGCLIGMRKLGLFMWGLVEPRDLGWDLCKLGCICGAICAVFTV